MIKKLGYLPTCTYFVYILRLFLNTNVTSVLGKQKLRCNKMYLFDIEKVTSLLFLLSNNNAAHRHVGETNMNVHSSRSHTIFRMVSNDTFKIYRCIASGDCSTTRARLLLCVLLTTRAIHLQCFPRLLRAEIKAKMTLWDSHVMLSEFQSWYVLWLTYMHYKFILWILCRSRHVILVIT